MNSCLQLFFDGRVATKRFVRIWIGAGVAIGISELSEMQASLRFMCVECRRHQLKESFIACKG